MSREEVQISDLEPSIIGEDVTRYAIQIRGVDGNGNEGPWSTILEYESPELLPSLESNNYVEGLSGWRLDNDGTFEVNDGLIRGTLQSANYVPNVSGWALDVGGNVEFSTGVFRGALRIGQNTFNVDSGGNLFIGGSTFNNSPFAVNTNGQIAAMSLNGDFIESRSIRGNRIRAGEIGADEISANYIYSNTIDAQQITAGFLSVDRLQVNTINGDRILNNTIGGGKIISLTADKINTGTLNANNVTISGPLSAVTIAIGSGNTVFRVDSLGNMWLGNSTFANAVFRVSNSGNMRANSGTFSGSLSSASGTFSGTLDATQTRVRALRNFSTNTNLEIQANDGSTADVNISANRDVSIFGTRGVTISAASSTTAGLFLASNFRIATNRTIRVGAMPAGSGTNVVRTSDGDLVTGSSSIRYKENVRPAKSIKNLLKVKPVIFDYKSEFYDPQNLNVYGAIAEDFEDLGLSQLLYYGEDGPESINYEKIGLALIPYVKELYGRIEELERRLDGS